MALCRSIPRSNLRLSKSHVCDKSISAFYLHITITKYRKNNDFKLSLFVIFFFKFLIFYILYMYFKKYICIYKEMRQNTTQQNESHPCHTYIHTYIETSYTISEN